MKTGMFFIGFFLGVCFLWIIIWICSYTDSRSESGIKIKVDFAPENKEKNPYKVGAYAIYIKRYWWGKWEVCGDMRYADIKTAAHDAEFLPPIMVSQRRL